MTITLSSLAVVREIQVRFQGGFAGQECALLAGASEADLQEVERFFPKDSNSLQVSFCLVYAMAEAYLRLCHLRLYGIGRLGRRYEYAGTHACR